MTSQGDSAQCPGLSDKGRTGSRIWDGSATLNRPRAPGQAVQRPPELESGCRSAGVRGTAEGSRARRSSLPWPPGSRAVCGSARFGSARRPCRWQMCCISSTPTAWVHTLRPRLCPHSTQEPVSGDAEPRQRALQRPAPCWAVPSTVTTEHLRFLTCSETSTQQTLSGCLLNKCLVVQGAGLGG